MSASNSIWLTLLALLPFACPAMAPGVESARVFRPAPSGASPQDPNLEFAGAPEWFRRCPALYMPTVRSAGAAMLSFGEQESPTLSDRIDSFRRLPELLERARRLGTETLCIVDYYQGWPQQPPEGFWLNKGDYLARSDLGGEQALKEGIAAVHERGGRVVLYVEGFIASKQSEVGRAHGEEWSIADESGPITRPYPGNWHMCPACEGWVSHLVEVCRRLVGEYGADGIYIDSFGMQLNWKCSAAQHGHPLGAAAVFNRGCAELVRRIRQTIQAANPEAVIVAEGPALPGLFAQIDGSQDWGIHTMIRRRLWNAAGRTDLFSAGWALDDLNQILALGHKLSLCDFWLQAPEGRSCLGSLPDWRPPFRGEAARRRYSEACSRRLHQWRNGGILMGACVPDIDDVAPRRMQNDDLFRSDSATEALLGRVRERAQTIDRALAETSGALPSPAERLRRLLEARVRLSPLIDDGANAAAVETGNEALAAYWFDSPRGLAATVVNVGNDMARLLLPFPRGELAKSPEVRLVDELGRQSFPATEAGFALSCPPHALMMLRLGEE